MNIQTITKLLTDAGIESNEAAKEVKMLLEHFCNYTEIDRCKGIMPDEAQLSVLYEKVLERTKTRIPIQYIIGESYFMGEYFKVTPDVLIPRDETEILVRKAIKIINDNNLKTALDVGTGSGCIACMIAKFTDCRIIGLDISTDALNTALDNASKLNLFNKAIFRKSDIFSNVKPGETFDIIISNPPYIPDLMKENLQPEVKYDPQIALFTKDEKGLEFYNKITENSVDILNKSGYLIFELGMGQAVDVKNIMCEKGYKNIEIIKDLAGIERVICGQL